MTAPRTPPRRRPVGVVAAALVGVLVAAGLVLLVARVRSSAPRGTEPTSVPGRSAFAPPGASAPASVEGSGAGSGRGSAPASAGAGRRGSPAASRPAAPRPVVPSPADVAVCGQPRGPLVPPPSDGPRPLAPALSGASGSGVADGSFGRWRGAPVQIAGTWNDSYEAQPVQCTLRPGYEYGAWRGDLDVAVGAIYKDRGETWSAAAAGAYDARWRSALESLRTAWGARPGVLHVRFAHEFNGDWVPWSVSADEVGDFVAAWRRFRALQRQILPRSLLVLCPNDRTSTSLGLDWRQAFPGSAYVDEMSVDSYNGHDFVATAADVGASLDAVDGTGAPVGLEQHRRFAASVGLPLAVSEWSSDADTGDSPAFVTAFFDWVRLHAGTGPGEVPYEILFNLEGFDGGRYAFFPTTRQPAAAAAYVRLW